MAYVPGLDGLRGVAVLAVLLHHTESRFAPGGFLGVSTFFTLSGFLITTILLVERRRTGRIDLGAFWARRIRRLLPAALLTIAAVVVAASVIGGDVQLAELRLDGFAALGNVANWRFLMNGRSYADLFTAPSPLQHFWSLAIEEQFYLVFPVLLVGVLAIGRSLRVLAGALVVLAAASVLSTVLLFSPGAVDAAYYATPSRAAELLIGALLAIGIAQVARRPRPTPAPARRWLIDVTALVAMGGLVALYRLADVNDAWLYRGGLAGVAVLGACVIRGALEPRTLTARALSFPPLRQLGVISYGVYLAHWPVFIWLDRSAVGFGGWALFGVQLAVTIAVAAVSYRFVERPIRSGRMPVVRRRIRWWALPPAVATVAAIVIVATLGPPAPQPIPSVTAAEASAALNDQARALDQQDRARPAGSAAPPRVLVVGDSVANRLGEGLVAWGRDSGLLEVANAGAAGCGLVTGGEVRVWGGTRVEDCTSWLDETWRDGVRTFRPDAVVVLSGPWDILERRLPGWSSFEELGDARFDDWLVAAYAGRARELAATGARIVWLTPPCAQEIAGPLYETGAFETSNLRYVGEHILERVREASGVDITLVDLFGHVCADGEPPLDVPGVSDDTRDGVHFTPEGARGVSEWLGPQIVALTT